MGAKSFIGTLYMGLLDANKALVGGYRKVGNAYPFSLQASTAQKKQISRLRESAGQNIDTKTTIADIVGSMTLREWNAKNLAWALSGEESALTGTSGTVDAGTPEDVVAVHDEYVKMDNRDISSVVIKDSTDATTYTVNTDYEINSALGLIKVLSTGAIADGATLHASYAYAAQSGYKVEIGTKAQIRVAILLDGEDEYSGAAINAEFDSVVLASSAEINFISEPDSEYEELPFSMTFETLSGNTSPGRINGIAL